jgi:hypothetical protein
MPNAIECFRAERVGDCTIASLTLVKLSGVLVVFGLPEPLGFSVESVSSNVLTQFAITLWWGTVLWRAWLNCSRRARWVAMKDRPFSKNVRTVKPGYSPDQTMVMTDNDMARPTKWNHHNRTISTTREVPNFQNCTVWFAPPCIYGHGH